MSLNAAERIAGEDHAALWAKTIALAARNAVEDLHAQGAFTDEQAPALNRRLRDHAYEALIAIRWVGRDQDEDAFTACLLDLIDDWEHDPLRAALRSAITNAVREFADAKGFDAETAMRLEHAAVDGALEVVDLYDRLGEREARWQLAFLISSIPSYWEPPQLKASLRMMLEDARAVRRGRAR